MSKRVRLPQAPDCGSPALPDFGSWALEGLL